MASTKRERELARRRAERQAARRAEAEARRRRRRATLLKSLAALLVVAVAGTLIALNYDFTPDKKKPSASATPSPGDCTYTKAGTAAKKVTGLPPATPTKREGTETATLATNRGAITLRLDAAKAPCTVNSFAFLAAQKYFDGTSCHRVTDSGIFVLQCGDPSTKNPGTGGPGYQFADENLTAFGTSQTVTYPAGTLAMANSGAGTNGSQFFLVYKDSPLAPAYTPFGTITGGLDMIKAVGAAGPTSAGDPKPKLPVTISRVTIS